MGFQKNFQCAPSHRGEPRAAVAADRLGLGQHLVRAMGVIVRGEGERGFGIWHHGLAGWDCVSLDLLFYHIKIHHPNRNPR